MEGNNAAENYRSVSLTSISCTLLDTQHASTPLNALKSKYIIILCMSHKLHLGHFQIFSTDVRQSLPTVQNNQNREGSQATAKRSINSRRLGRKCSVLQLDIKNKSQRFIHGQFRFVPIYVHTQFIFFHHSVTHIHNLK